jgi:hypothetical protein
MHEANISRSERIVRHGCSGCLIVVFGVVATISITFLFLYS